jgi:thioredoxin 1
MANLPELTDDNFDAEALQGQGLVLVDFWGPGCPPCRMVAPVIEELAKENAGVMRTYKVNIYDCPTVASNFGISSIPTLMFFKGGEVVDRLVGAQSKKRLQEAIDQAK